MKQSILNSKIAEATQKGYKVFTTVDGLPAPTTKQSNLYKAMQSAKDAGYKTVDYILGGHKRSYSDGFHMAVIVK